MSFETKPPAYNTGCLRYDFQIACTRKHPGVVLNLGCNEDPSNLRVTFGPRVINCDRSGWDEYMNRPNHVDRIFDVLAFPWPVLDVAPVDLALFGDILEHFPIEQSLEAIREAHRVAQNVCITVPEDTRIDEAAETEKWAAGEYNLHTTTITEAVIKGLLAEGGFELNWLVRGLWGKGGDWGEDGIYGWCARGARWQEGFDPEGSIEEAAQRVREGAYA